MNRAYTLDDTLTFSTTFLDRTTNEPKNPGAVVFRLRDPNGQESRPPVSNPRAGYFVASFTPKLAGVWHSRWEGSGIQNYAVEGTFEVRTSAFT